MNQIADQDPKRAPVIAQIITNTENGLRNLHGENCQLPQQKLLVPLIRAIVLNLNAWDTPEVIVCSLPQDEKAETYYIDRVPDFTDFRTPNDIDVEVGWMAYLVKRAKVQFDLMIAKDKRRPIGLYIHSFYFTKIMMHPDHRGHDIRNDNIVYADSFKFNSGVGIGLMMRGRIDLVK